MALAEREFAGTSKAVLESVAAAMQVPSADLDKVAAQALVSSIGRNFRLRRELALFVLNAGRPDILQLPLMKVEAAFVAAETPMHAPFLRSVCRPAMSMAGFSVKPAFVRLKRQAGQNI